MELLLLIIGVCAFDVLAVRFGRDSRQLGLHSAEERLAARGLVWRGRDFLA